MRVEERALGGHRWFTSRWHARYWHRGLPCGAVRPGWSMHYWLALCGAGAGADPVVIDAEVPPEFAGTPPERRVLCLRCVELDEAIA